MMKRFWGIIESFFIISYDHMSTTITICESWSAAVNCWTISQKKILIEKTKNNIVLFCNLLSKNDHLWQEGATYGPRATSGPQRPIFWHWNSLFGLNVARQTRIKAQNGPRTKIVAHPWSLGTNWKNFWILYNSFSPFCESFIWDGPSFLSLTLDLNGFSVEK